MLERLLVALLTGGHVLIEGVPGLAKTLTVRRSRPCSAARSGASSSLPTSSPPTSSARGSASPATARSHRARPRLREPPARRRDQPRAGEGAVGAARGHAGAPGDDRRRDVTACPSPSSCWPRRTRSSPRAPTTCPRRRSTASCSSSSSTTRASRTRSPSSTARSVEMPTPAPRGRRSTTSTRYQQVAREVFADRSILAYAVALVDATRHPGRYGLADLEPLIQFGASPRASLGLVQAARALALLRGRTHVVPTTSATSRPTCCATGSCSPTTRSPTAWRPTTCSSACSTPSSRARASVRLGGGRVTLVDPPGRQGPGPLADERVGAARPGVARRAAGRCPASAARAGRRHGHRARAAAPVRARRRPRASSTPRPARAPASRTSASTCPSAR